MGWQVMENLALLGYLVSLPLQVTLRQDCKPRHEDQESTSADFYFPSTGDGTQGLTQGGQAPPLSHTQVWLLQNQCIHFFFFLWKMRPKRLFYTTSTLVFVVWIFLFVWPVGSPLAFPDWLKHCIPANWPFMFKTKQKNLPQPWTQCSLLISRQCLWLKTTSAFEVCHSWHHKKSSGSSFTICIMHYNIQIFKN